MTWAHFPIFALSIATILIGVENPDDDTFIKKQAFLHNQEVRARFGAAPIDIKKFRKSSPEGRKKFVFSIITSKQFLEKTPKDVFDVLGPADGHFWNDTIPAYLIEVNKSKNANALQLVFLLNESGRVSSVKIHKVICCEK